MTTDARRTGRDGASALTIAETTPGPEELRLAGVDGERRTAAPRFTARDLRTRDHQWT